MEISIIIPTFNREAVLKQTLDNLRPLVEKYPIEIIIVNDGEALKGNYEDENIHVFKNPKKGVTAARNFGAANAKSDILFFLDDDMWCNEDAIKAILSFKERGLTNTSCFLMNWEYPAALKDMLSKEKIGRYLLNADYHKMEGRLKERINTKDEFMRIYSIGSGSFVIAKDIFDSIGGYDENFTFQGEDIALSQKITKADYSILIHTEITCFHNQRDRLDIEGMMDRNYRGYYSQFKNGHLLNLQENKNRIYLRLLPFRSLVRLIYSGIPNSAIFDKLSFRLLGVLGSLSKLKAYSDVKKINSLEI